MSTNDNKRNSAFVYINNSSNLFYSLGKVLLSLKWINNFNVKTKKVLSILLGSILLTPVTVSATTLGGVDLGNLTNYLFVFTNSYEDANLQAASKGFLGDIAVDGIEASERTSGTTAFSGTIFTNGSTQDAWQTIIDDNPSQSSGVTGENSRIADLQADLVSAIQQINALSPTPGMRVYPLFLLTD